MAELSTNGIRKAAIFLVSLEQDLAAKVLAQMDKDTIEQIGIEIAKLNEISKQENEKVMSEFYHISMAQMYIEQGGIPYARTLLEKVLPHDETQRIIDVIEHSMKMSPFGFLQKAESENLLTFLQNEHPQTISLILAHLPNAKAAEILSGLPAKKQLDVVKRLATMEHTSPEVISQVEQALEKKLAAIVTEEFKETGGVQTTAEILNLTDRATERTILDALEEHDHELAEEIRKRMFVFDDILQVNDRGIQNLLKEIDPQQLAMALKTASPELKEKFFKNMSKRAVEIVAEEMEFMGPVRLSDVEATQQAIVDMVRQLEDRGELFIQGRGGEEEIIV